MYVGNLPAVFDALSSAHSRPTHSDMIVAAGSTLTDRVRDGSVESALGDRQYSVVILQERGGDFACGFGPRVCADARKSLVALAKASQHRGARALLLGTYQAHPEASRAIVDAESQAAKEAGVDYLSVSDRLDKLRAALPDMEWFAADGMHPGTDLTLLNALLLFERVHGVRPNAVDLTLPAPIYSYAPGTSPQRQPDSDAADSASVPMKREYTSARINAILQMLW
jgi:hypothetical protein